MSRRIAFLRAINVGGHTVKMDRLRALFGEMGFAEVETFIASGNVLFEGRSGSGRALERRIEAALAGALGYPVPTFVRTLPELAAVVAAAPFAPRTVAAATTFNVAFLGAAPHRERIAAVEALRADGDAFHFRGREFYWASPRRQAESKFSNAVLEKALGAPSTMRGMNMLRKLAARTAPA